ncbi:MAG: GHKL domain-containing protein [Candidatus Omnitrophica bacterium]|nr:GHKL domain-containing protein [Candidatus Omnitrophota bacterium]MCF7893922.1 GHKL domain-containing protein [Candidatus Omnitrophota bacterium]
MLLIIVLILLYWLILAAFSFFIGEGSYLYAIFPFNFQELIFRFIGVFFILAGNLYLLFKTKKKIQKKESEKNRNSDQSYSLPSGQDFDYIRENQKDIEKNINIQDKYFIYRATNSILKLSFDNISTIVFIKLVFNLIISEKHFIDCVGAMAFFIGDQPDSLELQASYGIPAALVKECQTIKFQTCVCGKAAEDKSIQFSSNRKDCPISLKSDSFKQHSHYCIPLIYQEDLLGVVDLVVAAGTKREKESDEYLMAVANAVAIGIKYKQGVSQVSDINKCLSGLIGNPQENIKRLVNLYGEISRASCVFYKRYNQKTDSLSSFARYHPPQYYDDQESEGSIGYDILKNQKQFVVIRKLNETKYIKTNLNIIRNDFSTCIGSPVKFKEESRGVVYAFYKRDFCPDKKVKDNLGMIASAIGTEEERVYENKVLKEAYSKLKKAQGSLVQSEKLAALGRFSSGIAHEVKNPLGVVLGGVEFLERKISDPKKDIVIALKKVKDSTLRANNIVQNLLTFAKPSARKSENIDLKQLIQETLSLLKYKVSLVNIKIVNDVKESPEGIVGDKNQIQQVLFNLFLNAIEAMPKGGKLKIKMHRVSGSKGIKNKSSYIINIIDTGEGISEENLAKIFEPFFTTKRDTKGTGLGLAMCKMIIENNEGKLRIESKLNKGTTAKIILPINNQAESF